MATAFKKVSNNGQTILSAGIDSDDTTITIPTGHVTRFPSSGQFRIRLFNVADPEGGTAYQTELVLVTSGAGSTTWTVTRNYDSQGAYAFSSGNAVRLIINADDISDIQTAVNAAENDILTNTTSISNIITGWTPTTETWTYASSTTFTVIDDRTAVYFKGDKIKLSQSATTKYFNITNVSYSTGTTTITITGGTDYTLANSTITDTYYSKIENPSGFPGRFNFTATYTGFTTTVTATAQFKVSGTEVRYWIPGILGTSNATTCTITGLPITITTAVTSRSVYTVRDNTTDKVAFWFLTSGNIVDLRADITGGAFTASGQKGPFDIQFSGLF